MAFMMLVTMTAMVIDLQNYWAAGNALLTFVAACIFLLSVWLTIEAVLRFRSDTLTRAPVPEAADGD
jgi:hypothetical protein